jgi:hypothetical protein
MKWIEMIRVRSSAAALEEITPSLVTEIDQINELAEQVEAFIMQHALYSGDLSLVIVWKNGRPPEKSPQGLIFADRLQQVGTVDHAVWLPIKSDQPNKE